MDKVEKFISAAETLIELYRKDNNLGEDEPLDGDDVDSLINGVRNFINLHQGNITQEEFYELEGDLDMDIREVTLKIDAGY
jgi:hypothetical protein